MPTTVREIIRMLESDGWVQIASKGSHRHYKHPTKKGKVTVPVHMLSDELRPGTLNSILKQAGLR